jgi:low temperature requirement protein LtrA
VRTTVDGVSEAQRTAIRRVRAGVRGETNIEVFFDLVFAFAVTQISHYLLEHATLEGALQAVVLLLLVWLVWFYTTTVTNWLNPNHPAVRLVLVALMLASLVMSASIPDAFGDRGLAVGGAYAAMQVGRSVFTVLALRGDRLQRNFERLLVWSIVSGVLAVAGGIADGHSRELLWLSALGVDLLGGVVGLYVPGLGRSTTHTWDIDGSHLAERTQSFVMIAIGESIIVVGAGLAGGAAVTPVELTALAIAFGASVAIWWIYFDRSAGEAGRVLAASSDPGRLGRTAYAYVHPVMIAGIIAIAAGDHVVLANPLATAAGPTMAMLFGGTILFLFGHALFKLAVWNSVSWTRLGGIVVLGVLGVVGSRMPAITVAACAGGVVALVAVADHFHYVWVLTRNPSS